MVSNQKILLKTVDDLAKQTIGALCLAKLHLSEMKACLEQAQKYIGAIRRLSSEKPKPTEVFRVRKKRNRRREK